MLYLILLSILRNVHLRSISSSNSPLSAGLRNDQQGITYWSVRSFRHRSLFIHVLAYPLKGRMQKWTSLRSIPLFTYRSMSHSSVSDDGKECILRWCSVTPTEPQPQDSSEEISVPRDSRVSLGNDKDFPLRDYHRPSKEVSLRKPLRASSQCAGLALLELGGQMQANR
jgi:hypothetical protein